MQLSQNNTTNSKWHMTEWYESTMKGYGIS